MPNFPWFTKRVVKNYALMALGNVCDVKAASALLDDFCRIAIGYEKLSANFLSTRHSRHHLGILALKSLDPNLLPDPGQNSAIDREGALFLLAEDRCETLMSLYLWRHKRA